MKFLLTNELGRLAKWLRILGFDARYEPSANKSLCMVEALKDERIVVTRNLRFGKRHGGTIIFIRHDELEGQLNDLKEAIDLKIDAEHLFSRCTICNIALKTIEKKEVRESVPAYVYESHEDFMRCPKCLRVYWQGTHWGNVTEILKKIKN